MLKAEDFQQGARAAVRAVLIVLLSAECARNLLSESDWAVLHALMATMPRLKTKVKLSRRMDDSKPDSPLNAGSVSQLPLRFPGFTWHLERRKDRPGELSGVYLRH